MTDVRKGYFRDIIWKDCSTSHCDLASSASVSIHIELWHCQFHAFLLFASIETDCVGATSSDQSVKLSQRVEINPEISPVIFPPSPRRSISRCCYHCAADMLLIVNHNFKENFVLVETSSAIFRLPEEQGLCILFDTCRVKWSISALKCYIKL